jgi:isopentenyldiphosphate isomerase
MGNLRTHALINAVTTDDRIVGVVDRAKLPDVGANFRVAHVIVSNSRGHVLLQHIAAGQRSAGRWGSSAASYLLKDESYVMASERALALEIGLRARPRWIGKFAMQDLGGVKFVGVFAARADGPFSIDQEQVSEVRFFKPAAVAEDIASRPDRYTETFKRVFEFFTASPGR